MIDSMADTKQSGSDPIASRGLPTDGTSLFGLAHATAERAAQLRLLATTARLGATSARDAVSARRAGPPLTTLRELRSVLTAARLRAEHLERALLSNRRIGIATGILMVTRHLREDEAFECLRQESQRRNVKLRELAEQVIYTGRL